MNKIKSFLLRGTIFAGFGPLIYALVILVIDLTGVDPMLNGLVVFKGFISTYLLAFIVSGMSIIWKEERLGFALQMAIHASFIYACYLVTYLINGWLNINFIQILFFTIIFILGYGIIWIVIYLIERNKVNKLNKQLK